MERSDSRDRGWGTDGRGAKRISEPDGSHPGGKRLRSSPLGPDMRSHPWRGGGPQEWHDDEMGERWGPPPRPGLDERGGWRGLEFDLSRLLVDFLATKWRASYY